MTHFPIERLTSLPGTLSGSTGDVSIVVPVELFELRVEGSTIEVETSLRLDCIDLPSIDLVELAGRTFRFPKNPEDGYIDGSIYIYHSHHPADVTRITFGSISLVGIAVEMDVELCFEFEGLGEFENTDWKVSTTLRRGKQRR